MDNVFLPITAPIVIFFGRTTKRDTRPPSKGPLRVPMRGRLLSLVVR